jgi:transcriptional regulator with XRE-family HTH domain
MVNMSNSETAPLAANLRRLRRRQGLSTVELARRAGTSRATLTQLEAGGGNPTLDTLYALATALEAPLAELIAGPPVAAPPRIVRAGDGTRVVGDAVEAWLLDTAFGRVASHEIYDFRLHSGAVQNSAAHPRGTREHLHLYSGRIRVGPTVEPAEIAAGDFVSFDADRDHLYQRIGAEQVSGLLVITRTEP